MAADEIHYVRSRICFSIPFMSGKLSGYMHSMVLVVAWWRAGHPTNVAQSRWVDGSKTRCVCADV